MKSSTISSTREALENEKEVRILTVNWNENIIGYLMKEKDGDYYYKYDYKGIQEARKLGYQYLIGFKDIRKVYTSKELFPVFKSRIPTKQRRDLPEILKKIGIENYDELDLLALSGGRLLTDAISFREYLPEEAKNKYPKRTVRKSMTSKRINTREGEDRKVEADGR